MLLVLLFLFGFSNKCLAKEKGLLHGLRPAVLWNSATHRGVDFNAHLRFGFFSLPGIPARSVTAW